MSVPVPRFIAQRYQRGAHEFRSRKRMTVQAMKRQLHELRIGAAYFPNGAEVVNQIHKALKQLENDLSVKVWGR